MTKPNESLIVLPPERNDIFAAYTHERFNRPDCPGAEPHGDVWYTVEVVEHDKKKGAQRCVLPQRAACDYTPGTDITM